MEIWKDIKGFEGIYQVSNLGRVKSLPRKVKCRGGKYRNLKESILKNSLNNTGYYRVNLKKNLKCNLKLVHRLVGEAFISNPENKATINHKDGNKLNNKTDNLEWLTNQENVKHAWHDLKLNFNKRRVLDLSSGNIFNSLEEALPYSKYSKSHLSAMLNGHYNNKSGFLYID